MSKSRISLPIVETQPDAHAMAFRIFRCGDPECGPHVVLYDEDSKALCQFIMSRENFECFVAEMRTFYPERLN